MEKVFDSINKKFDDYVERAKKQTKLYQEEEEEGGEEEEGEEA